MEKSSDKDKFPGLRLHTRNFPVAQSENTDSLQTDIRELVQELDTRRTELEQQNKDLRQALLEFEKSNRRSVDRSGSSLVGPADLHCKENQYRAVGRDIASLKKAEEELQQESRLRQLFLDALPCIALLVKSETRQIVAFNKAALAAGAVCGTTCYTVCAQGENPCSWCLAPKLWATGQQQNAQFRAFGKYWDAYWVLVDADHFLHYLFDITEKHDLVASLRDRNERLSCEIATRKTTELELQEARTNLEQQVKERTVELTDTVDELKNVLKILLMREKELQEKNRELVDTNTALSIMLKRRELEHEDIRKEYATKTGEMVLPLLKKAQNQATGATKDYLETAQANLLDVFSKLPHNIVPPDTKLAPRELQIVHYIRLDKTSKEIADLLDLSVRTIESYRENIRKKLRLKNQKKNLKKFITSYL